MPTYLFRHLKSKRTWTEFMTISEMEQFLRENPEVEQLVNGAPAIGDPIALRVKRPSGAFRERLQEIHKNAGKHSKVETWN